LKNATQCFDRNIERDMTAGNRLPATFYPQSLFARADVNGTSA
jgi:hypothetical protein